MPEDETIDGYQNLQVLSLADCSLSGKIPHWLSKLQNLKELFLYSNQLTGSITSLEHLPFRNNHLQETLDPEYVVLSSKLVILDLGENGLMAN